MDIEVYELLKPAIGASLVVMLLMIGAFFIHIWKKEPYKLTLRRYNGLQMEYAHMYVQARGPFDAYRKFKKHRTNKDWVVLCTEYKGDDHPKVYKYNRIELIGVKHCQY